MKKKLNNVILSEVYEVKFWITNDQGFKEQQMETFRCNSKSAHKRAEKSIIDKYRKLGKKIDIINVTYC